MSLPARILLISVCAGAPVAAQTVTATLSANLGSLAKLSVSSSSLAFPDGDPDVFPQLDAAPVTITAKARATEGSTIALTVQASDDLRSGLVTIPADALSWVATGSGFRSGTVSRTAPQVVASWTGSGVRVGTQTYTFRNRWSYAAGTYSVSLLYTLTSP